PFLRKLFDKLDIVRIAGRDHESFGTSTGNREALLPDHLGVSHFHGEFEFMFRAAQEHALFLSRASQHPHFRSAARFHCPSGDTSIPVSESLGPRTAAIKQASQDAPRLVQANPLNPIGSNAAVAIAQAARQTLSIHACVVPLDDEEIIAASFSFKKGDGG